MIQPPNRHITASPHHQIPLLIMLTLLLLPATLHAGGTNTGGAILTNTTWTPGNSPYTVVNSIIVGADATLTIQPGVEVRIADGLSITIGSNAFGPGTLKALGSASQPILFTSATNPGHIQPKI